MGQRDGEWMRKRVRERGVGEETRGDWETLRRRQESGKEIIGAHRESQRLREPGFPCGLSLPYFFPGASKTRKRKQQRGEGTGVGGPGRAPLPILLRQPLPTFSGCNTRWNLSAPPPWATPACTGRQVLSRVCLCVCIQVWGWAGGVLHLSIVSQPWLSV